VDEDEQTPAWRAAPPSVLAVIVSSRGERWLPQTLASLGRLEHLPTRWIAVDVGPGHDETGALLRDALGAEHVITAEEGVGFGAAVARAVEHADADAEWIWLLHDDAIVDPKALIGLLDEATGADDVAVVGPKIREWPSLRRILEVGRTITGTGSLETGLEPGEPDAGQYDWPRDVLAVNTAGMLVRRDVWDELGGFDPALPLFFDDVDFGWRTARAGYRTRTAPSAVIFHAEAATRRVRRRRPIPGERRVGALYTILANETGPRFWWQSIRLLLGTLLRVIADLLFKDTRAARGQLAALRTIYCHPGRMRAARRIRASTGRTPRRELRPLFTSPWLPYQHGADVVVESITAMVRPEAVQTLGRRSSSGGLLDEESIMEEQEPWWRRYRWATTLLVLTVLAVVASRGLWTGSAVSPVLPPAPDSVGQWWDDLFARSAAATGLGSAAWPAPYLPVLALLGLPLWFAPGLGVWFTLVFAAPLAALTAHRFGRLITDRRTPRMIWAVSYGLLAVVGGASAQGRLGTVVALVLLPVVANSITRLITGPSWTGAARAALWLAIASTFAPAAFLIVVLALVGVLLTLRLRPNRQLAVAVALAVLVAGPSWWARFIDPIRLWWEAGVPSGVSVTALDVATGLGGGPGGAPGWLSVAVILLGALALIPSSARVGVTLCWVVALSGLLIGLIGTLIPPVAGPDGASAWSGLGASVWLAGLGTAALLAVPALTGFGRAATAGVTVLALLFAAGAGAWWLVRGVADPVASSADPEVPAYLADQGSSTLVLSGTIDDGVAAEVVVGGGPHLGQEGVRADDGRIERFSELVAGLIADPDETAVSQLAEAGVDAVYLPDADPQIAQRVSAAPGLAPAGSDRPGSLVWTVEESADDAERPRASAARPAAVAVWVVAWLALAAGAVPSRRRTREEIS